MKLSKFTPNFEVANIKETINFYEQVFGFSVIHAVPKNTEDIHLTIQDDTEYVYASIQKDGIEIMLQESENFKESIIYAKDLKIGASIAFYAEVEGIDTFYTQLKQQVKEITELTTSWYGMKEFFIKDINGYILCFAENINK